MRLLYNILLLQIGWFACILGAAYGMPFLGPLLVLGLLAVHLSVGDDRRRELLLLLAAGVFGTVLDSLLLSFGAISFESQWASWLVPLWMTALWVNFAMTLNVSMRWLNGRYLLAMVLGALSGPMAYYAGAKLGAVSLAASWSLFAIGLEWALAMPALLLMNRILSRMAFRKPLFQEATG